VPTSVASISPQGASQIVSVFFNLTARVSSTDGLL
jgi:hypothetical protein